MEIKHLEAEDMKREMDEVQQRKYAEYDDRISNVISNTYCVPSAYDRILESVKFHGRLHIRPNSILEYPTEINPSISSRFFVRIFRCYAKYLANLYAKYLTEFHAQLSEYVGRIGRILCLN